MVNVSRTHETVTRNTRKGSNTNAGGIGRANYGVEKQLDIGEAVAFNHRVLLFSRCVMHRGRTRSSQLKQVVKTPYERL